MTEIKRDDLKNAAKSLLNPLRLLGLAVAVYICFLWFGLESEGFAYLALVVLGVSVGMFLGYSRQDFLNRRFRNPEYRSLWSAVVERHHRLRQAIKKCPAHIKDGLQEMPRKIEETAKQLYSSLRRADIVKSEIIKSEGPLGAALPFYVNTSDRETSELYMLADKNVAEYRKHYESVIAKVTRTEGQCAVFISAMDALRVQLLGYRLSGGPTGQTSKELIEVMQEVRGQLEAINEALDELDLLESPVERIESTREEDSSEGKIQLGPP